VMYECSVGPAAFFFSLHVLSTELMDYNYD
jgi:hypothetical protein